MNGLTKKGRVFIIFTIEDVKRTFHCADNKATRLLRKLEEFGLIERKRRGQGKPCLVYVKNFSAEFSKENVKNRDNDDSCGSKTACQDPVKSRGIKRKIFIPTGVYSCCVRHEQNRSENCCIVFPQMGVSRMGYGYCNIMYGQIRQKSLIFFVYL